MNNRKIDKPLLIAVLIFLFGPNVQGYPLTADGFDENVRKLSERGSCNQWIERAARAYDIEIVDIYYLQQPLEIKIQTFADYIKGFIFQCQTAVRQNFYQNRFFETPLPPMPEEECHNLFALDEINFFDETPRPSFQDVTEECRKNLDQICNQKSIKKKLDALNNVLLTFHKKHQAFDFHFLQKSYGP